MSLFHLNTCVCVCVRERGGGARKRDIYTFTQTHTHPHSQNTQTHNHTHTHHQQAYTDNTHTHTHTHQHICTQGKSDRGTFLCMSIYRLRSPIESSHARRFSGQVVCILPHWPLRCEGLLRLNCLPFFRRGFATGSHFTLSNN